MIIKSRHNDFMRLIRLIKTKRTKNRDTKDRLNAVKLARRGRSATYISKKSHKPINWLETYSPSWVQKWVTQYNKHGLNGILNPKRRGNPGNLTKEQLSDFLWWIKVKRLAVKHEILRDKLYILYICTVPASQIKILLKERYNADYSLIGVYKLLDRLKIFRRTWDKNKMLKMPEDEIISFLNRRAHKISLSRKAIHKYIDRYE